MTWYELHYEYEDCYDDGGVGHESGWTRSKHEFAASTDEAARRKATKWLKEKRARAKPCPGAFCSNRGRTRVLVFLRIDYEERKVNLPKSAMVGLAV